MRKTLVVNGERRFDDRTTQQVEMTRSLHNRKPFRNKKLKEEARSYAKQAKDGSWHSPIETMEHAPPKSTGIQS